jgi:predicted nucleotidyltransferase
MPRPPLPEPIGTLAAQLAELDGAMGVVLGGSRATGAERPDSDWDLGVYYRGSQRPLDPEHVRGLGHPGYVSELGEWGPIMDGGAWLTVDGTAVDVLFRDIDTVERWLADAECGRFEVLMQNGYVVGAPTYVLVGELAINLPLSGDLPRPGYPEPLAAAASARWRGRAGVSLMFAEIHATAADAACCAGMLADAVLSTAHARLAEQREWVVNEKRLVERAGLDEVQPLLGGAGATGVELAATVRAVADALGVQQLRAR